MLNSATKNYKLWLFIVIGLFCLTPLISSPVALLMGFTLASIGLVPEHIDLGKWTKKFKDMYGEDVDLSYRIQKAGFKNYYFADSSIIHFKGESTRKGSMNYVRIFYNAMSIFVRKHYGGSKAGVFNFLIHSSISFLQLAHSR